MYSLCTDHHTKAHADHNEGYSTLGNSLETLPLYIYLYTRIVHLILKQMTTRLCIIA
jgi:hypothetical protein